MTTKRKLTAEEKAMAARMKAIISTTPDITEESVGAIVGVSQGQVSHWTGGRLPVAVGRAVKLAGALGIADPAEISVAYRDLVGTRLAGAGPGKESQPMRLDPAMIAEVVRALKLRYAGLGGYEIEDRPELFAAAYEMRLGMDDAYVSPEVFELVIRYADLTPQGAGKDGRSNGAPAHGADERKVGRRGAKA